MSETVVTMQTVYKWQNRPSNVAVAMDTDVLSMVPIVKVFTVNP